MTELLQPAPTTGAVAEMQESVRRWLRRRAPVSSKTQQLRDWLEGYGLPPREPGDEGYWWVQRAMPEEDDRAMRTLAEIIVALLREGPAERSPLHIPERFWFNVLTLCARSKCPALLSRPLLTAQASGVVQGTWRGADLRAALRRAIRANLASLDDLTWALTDLEGPPLAADDLAAALAGLAERLDGELARYRVFREALDVVRAARRAPRFSDAELIVLSDTYSWPVWTATCWNPVVPVSRERGRCRAFISQDFIRSLDEMRSRQGSPQLQQRQAVLTTLLGLLRSAQMSSLVSGCITEVELDEQRYEHCENINRFAANLQVELNPFGRDESARAGMGAVMEDYLRSQIPKNRRTGK